MSETPPENADQDQRDGYGSQANQPSWPDRPEYGQATTPRYGPQSDQAGAAVPPSPGGAPAPGGPPTPGGPRLPGGAPAGRVGRNEPTRMMSRDALGLPSFGQESGQGAGQGAGQSQS